MGWGADYTPPAELAEQRAQQDAALEAQQRAKLSQFERRVVDLLADIAGSLKKIADNSEPIYQLDAQTGRVDVQHGNRDELREVRDESYRLHCDLLGINPKTGSSEGDVGTASAEPVTPPGSARPESSTN